MRCRIHRVMLLVLVMVGSAAPWAASANEAARATALKGTYVAVRHGESVPSSERRICSSMAAGVDPRNGLTPKGRAETSAATEAWIDAQGAQLENALRNQRLVILTSPFSRTRETAAIIAETLERRFATDLAIAPGTLNQQIRVEPALRERDFGGHEGSLRSDRIYPSVWAEDARDPDFIGGGVERAAAVQRRMLAVVFRLEAESHADAARFYVLVAHGDPLKILAAGFSGLSASAHQDSNQVPPFATAEFRTLRWVVTPAVQGNAKASAAP